MNEDLMFLKEDYYSKRPTKASEKGGPNPITPIVSLLFKSLADTHITHLMQATKSMAVHKVLEDYYDGPVEDYVDDLMEVSMAMHPEENLTISACAKFDNPIQYFRQLHKQVEQLRQNCKNSTLQSMIDMCQQEVMHTIYRLEYTTGEALK